MFVLSEVREIYHELKDLSMHIVREEHWAANRSHAYMVNVSNGQKKSSISYEIILLPNASSIKFEESNICFLCCPGMDVQVENFPIEKSCMSCLLETLYRRHGGTPLRHLVKTYVCGDNPWESKLIKTRCRHY